MNKLFRLSFLLFLISFRLQSAEVIRVSKNKILFTISGIKKFGVGTIIKITDGSEEVGRAKVTKIGVKKAVAKVFKGKNLISKGYKISIILLKMDEVNLESLVENKKVKKGGTSEVPRKLAVLGGLSFQSVGSMTGGDSLTPTGFGSYIGFKTELNYRFSSIGVLVGFDYHQGAEAVQMPPQSFTTETFDANGEMSDIYLGAQYFLDRFHFNNYYVTGMFFPIVGHKIKKNLDTGSEFQSVYSGSGIALGGGKEWIFGKWIIQANALFKKYSLTTIEDNLGTGSKSVTISHSAISLNAMVGYHF